LAEPPKIVKLYSLSNTEDHVKKLPTVQAFQALDVGYT